MWGRIPAVAVLVLVALAADDASAAPVTVGSPLTASFTQDLVGGPATLLNSALGDPGATLAAPFSGRVVRWRVAGDGTFRLVVLRPQSGGTYAQGPSSDPVLVTAPGPTTVPASLPIRTGDVVALENMDSEATIGVATAAGSLLDDWMPPLQSDPRAPDGREPDTEAAFNADVLRAPALASLSHAPAPPEGGTSVVITGTDLGETSAVTFGTVPAASFSVESDTQVTAVSPPQGVDPRVTLSVTTPAGVARMAFGYTPPPRVVRPPVLAPVTFTVVRRPVATRTGVRLRVACAGPPLASCVLTARLGATRHGRRVPVGAITLPVGAGKTFTVDVKLNATGRRLLARLRRLPVRFTATVKAGGRPRATLPSRALVLHARR